MTYQELRAKYPRFIFRNFVRQRIGSDLKVTYNFETPPDHYFKHQMVFKDFPSGIVRIRSIKENELSNPACQKKLLLLAVHLLWW